MAPREANGRSLTCSCSGDRCGTLSYSGRDTGLVGDGVWVRDQVCDAWGMPGRGGTVNLKRGRSLQWAWQPPGWVATWQWRMYAARAYGGLVWLEGEHETWTDGGWHSILSKIRDTVQLQERRGFRLVHCVQESSQTSVHVTDFLIANMAL